MAQSYNPIIGIVLVVLFLYIVLPESEHRAESLLLSNGVHERISHFWSSLDVLNGTKWGDFSPKANAPDQEPVGRWLNITGFREEDGFEWETGLGRFHERALDLSRYAMPVTRVDEAQTDRGWGSGHLPVWANASGTLHGEWVQKHGPSPVRTPESYNLTKNVPWMHWMGAESRWARNITGDTGKMVVILEGNRSVTEYKPLAGEESGSDGLTGGGLVRNIKATIELEDTHGSRLTWDMRLWGTHWPRRGAVLLTTTSEKFDGVFGLPHLAPSADLFQSSQTLLNQTLGDTIRTKESDTYYDQDMPWNSDIENPGFTLHQSPQCELVVYAQVHPPSREELGVPAGSPSPEAAMQKVLSSMESELLQPRGIPVGSMPALRMSAVAYSPDCGFFLETKGPPEFPPSDTSHLTGLKKEVHLRRVKQCFLAFAAIIYAQVFVLKSQVTESSTPSTMARISFGTMSFMVMADMMVLIASSVWMSTAGATFLPTLVLMFAAFLGTVIGASFLAKIHEVQIPETRDQNQRRDTGNTTPASTNPPASEDRVPSPLFPGLAGAPPPPPPPAPPARPPLDEPIIVPSDQDIDAEIAEANAAPAQPGQQTPQQTPAQAFQSTLGRYMLGVLILGIVVLSSQSWHTATRSLLHNATAAAYLSMWLPQIHRNVMRNCRRALRWRFVAGQSVLRLLPIAYFWCSRDNFLYAETDRPAFALLCAWVWLQMALLYGQDVLGPRFGVPESWTPDAWDYHPVLSEDSLESGGMPIGLLVDDDDGSSLHDASAKGDVRHIDCAICRELLEVPVIKAGQDPSSVTATLARRSYMVTPCRHVFHTPCLEAWMRFRLQCPNCREELPPL